LIAQYIECPWMRQKGCTAAVTCEVYVRSHVCPTLHQVPLQYGLYCRSCGTCPRCSRSSFHSRLERSKAVVVMVKLFRDPFIAAINLAGRSSAPTPAPTTRAATDRSQEAMHTIFRVQMFCIAMRTYLVHLTVCVQRTCLPMHSHAAVYGSSANELPVERLKMQRPSWKVGAAPTT